VLLLPGPQVSWTYGLPQVALELDVTTAPVVLAETDRNAVQEIYQTCCPTAEAGTLCDMWVLRVEGGRAVAVIAQHTSCSSIGRQSCPC
jgi:hypothetical protein